jgi:hypothetical protein
MTTTKEHIKRSRLYVRVYSAILDVLDNLDDTDCFTRENVYERLPAIRCKGGEVYCDVIVILNDLVTKGVLDTNGRVFRFEK